MGDASGGACICRPTCGDLATRAATGCHRRLRVAVLGPFRPTVSFPPLRQDPSKPGIAGEATGGARRVAKNYLTVVAIAEDGTVSTRPTAARSQNPGQAGEASIERRHRWVLESGSATRVWRMFREQAASN